MKLIPDELLRAHEDGKVVFFCGAGVSQSAGLPSFKELVRRVTTDLLPPEDKCTEGKTEALAWAAYKRGEYDEALGLLESPHLGTFSRERVRGRVRHHLSSPATKTPAAHKALVQLTDLDQGTGSLVTTNFDRLLETAYESVVSGTGHSPTLEKHVAPSLPPARPTAFRGVVYLHGRLDGGSDQHDKDLVLTKSDFGLAYMLDGWARRFVVDLFRHYHVVFVGYSAEDPPMRYLTAAMNSLRSATPNLFGTAFSFAPYCESTSGGDREIVTRKWESKGIQPILYDSADEHIQLWNTIHAWADRHRRDLRAHRKTVGRLSHITLSGKDDPQIDEMLSALRVPGIAKYFADLVRDDRPDPAWIGALQKRGFLSRSRVSPR